jgi:hypothetical protein
VLKKFIFARQVVIPAQAGLPAGRIKPSGMTAGEFFNTLLV